MFLCGEMRVVSWGCQVLTCVKEQASQCKNILGVKFQGSRKLWRTYVFFSKARTSLSDLAFSSRSAKPELCNVQSIRKHLFTESLGFAVSKAKRQQ